MLLCILRIQNYSKKTDIWETGVLNFKIHIFTDLWILKKGEIHQNLPSTKFDL